MDLNHLHLAVKNVNQSKKFYTECFGFRDKEMHGNMLFMQNDNNFMLALDPDCKPEKLPSWFHFGFHLDSADAVKKMYEKVQTFNVEIPRTLETYDDFVFFHCEDIDGYRIEVYWEQ